jgi:hypothetical protein
MWKCVISKSGSIPPNWITARLSNLGRRSSRSSNHELTIAWNRAKVGTHFQEKQMAKSNDTIFTLEEVRQWLQREVGHVMKEAELRVKDATDFVTAYATGKISAKEAAERMSRYDGRWGEASLIVAMPHEGMTNEEILRRLDLDRATPEEGWTKHSRNKGGDGKGL